MHTPSARGAAQKQLLAAEIDSNCSQVFHGCKSARVLENVVCTYSPQPREFHTCLFSFRKDKKIPVSAQLLRKLIIFFHQKGDVVTGISEINWTALLESYVLPRVAPHGMRSDSVN